MITLKSAREISHMREAGRIVAMALQELGKRVAPGVTTGELNQFADEFLRRAGCGAGVSRIPGVPRQHLRFGKRRGGTRDSGFKKTGKRGYY